MAPNCSTLTGSEFDLCDYLYPSTPTCPGDLYYTDNGTCYNYTSAIAKSGALLGDDAGIDSGNQAWMLASAALVMIMTPALGLFYAGLSGEETSSNTLMMSFGTMCVVTVQWWLFGYSFAFGPGNDAFGSFQWGAFTNVGPYPSGAYGLGISHVTFAVFQLMFAIITPAIISGSVIGRMKFTTYLLFVFIWTTVVYDPLAHWVWSFTVTDTGSATALGWLGVKGAADFAGGTVIHISSGAAALACAIVLGKRQNYRETPVVKPHNVPMVIMGMGFLWFGWFGFNAGSAAGAGNVGGAVGTIYNGLASTAFLNTHVATATAAFSWMVLDKLVTKKMTPVGAACGAVAGLVAITPACGFVEIWAAFVIGIVVVPFCYFAPKFKLLLGIDDTLDAFALHGVGGIVGAFMTGLLASPNINGYTGAFYGNVKLLEANCADIAVALAFSFCLTFVIMTILKYTVGVRIEDDAEQAGIDVSEHGGKSYNN